MSEGAVKIRFVVRLLTAVFVSILSYLVLLSPLGEALDQYSYDLLFRMRGPTERPDDIVVVAIDETSFGEVGLQWPWPRSLHARLIEQLFQAGAKGVVFDIIFADPSTPEDDQALADVIDRYENVVLAAEMDQFSDPVVGYTIDESIIEPLPIIDRAKGFISLGHVKAVVDSDGFLRRVRLQLSDIPALALSAADLLRPGLEEEMVAQHEDLLINFFGSVRSVMTIPYYQALEPTRFLPKGIFEGKLVFVGLATLSQASLETRAADHFPVPFSRWYGGYMSGVEVHAHGANSILRGNFLRTFPRQQVAVFSLLIGVLSGILFLSFRPLVSGFLYLIVAAAMFAIAVMLFSVSNLFASPAQLLLPMTSCFAVSPFLHYWFTLKQKQFVRRAFSTYLAPRLVNQLLEDPDKLELGGEERLATVVFLDLAGFTSFSENLGPNELIGLVNRNLGKFAETVMKWDGMIDKYIGDCIMAVWGVPIYQEQHAVLACSAVLEIRDTLAELLEAEKELTGVSFSVRVGINSGLVVAGNVGGGQQFNYTVLGNEVNLASRLEGINKFYGTNFIISGSTADLLGDDFVIRELDTVRVKGQENAVRVCELCGKAASLSELQKKIYESFAIGRAEYLKRNFEQAKKSFAECLAQDPDDGPARVMHSRCEEYLKEAPPSDWDGVTRMLEK